MEVHLQQKGELRIEVRQARKKAMSRTNAHIWRRIIGECGGTSKLGNQRKLKQPGRNEGGGDGSQTLLRQQNGNRIQGKLRRGGEGTGLKGPGS